VRYLNPSALVAAKYLATEAMRHRRPRRARRVRAYTGLRPRPFRPNLPPLPSHPVAPAPLDVLHAVLGGLHRLELAR